MRLNQSVTQLNSFLHEELSASEGIKKALDEMAAGPTKTALEKIGRSHQSRAEALKKKIIEMGGKPAQESPAWDMSTEDDASFISDLDERESQELSDYTREMVALDKESRIFVERSLVPEVRKVHDDVEKLKHTIH